MKFLFALLLLSTSQAQANVCRTWSQPKVAGALDSSVLREASGAVVSRAIANRAYHIVDGDTAPHLTITELNGKLVHNLPVPQLSMEADTEELSYGPCNSGTCIFIGNIGDNDKARQSIAVLAIKEERSYSAPAQVVSHLTLRYPEWAANAEAMIVHPRTGDLFIFTKEESAKKSKVPPSRIFRLKKENLMKSQGDFTLEPFGVIDVAALIPQGKKKDHIVTGASVSQDGSKLLLITQGSAIEIAWDFSSRFKAASELRQGRDFSFVGVSLPQPEAISYLNNNRSFIVTSEAGGKKDTSTPILQFDCMN